MNVHPDIPENAARYGLVYASPIEHSKNYTFKSKTSQTEFCSKEYAKLRGTMRKLDDNVYPLRYDYQQSKLLKLENKQVWFECALADATSEDRWKIWRDAGRDETRKAESS